MRDSPARRPRSVRTRLTVWLIVVLVAGLTAAGVANVLLVRAFLVQRSDDQLLAMRERIAVLEQSAGGPAEISEATIRRVMPAHAAVYLLRDDGGLAVALSGEGGDTPQLPAAALQDRPQTPTGYHDGLVWLRALTVPMAGAEVSVQGLPGGPVAVSAAIVAIDMAPDRATIARLGLTEVVVGLVVAVVGGLVTAGLLRGGLRPLTEMASAARRVARGEPSSRLPASQASREAADLAEAVNEALDDREAAENRLRSFVADASHELRTPLTTVHGWADLYLQGGLPPAGVDDAMERIERSSTRMRRIVDDLGLLARVDAGLPLHLAETDLLVLVSEAVDDAHVVDPDRVVTLEDTTGAGRAVVRCDAERVAQVIRNLVGNAMQHTPSTAGVDVRVGVDGPVARLEVADHGPGIAPEDLPHVFERFYRSRARPSGEGSGLGLAIVQGIVQAHGGTVWVRSALGVGTTVTVELQASGPPAG